MWLIRLSKIGNQTAPMKPAILARHSAIHQLCGCCLPVKGVRSIQELMFKTEIWDRKDASRFEVP